MAYNAPGYSADQNAVFRPFQIGSRGVQNVAKQSFGDRLLQGEEGQYQRIPNQTPQAMQYLQQLLSGASQGLQNPEAGFSPIRNAEINRFKSDIIPGLTEQFTAGLGDSRGSSALTGALGSAASGLGERLASMQAQYGLQNRQSLLAQGSQGLTPQFETQYKERNPGLWENLFSSLAGPALQSAAGSFGKSAGNWAGNKSFGQQGGGDIESIIKKILMFA